MMCGLQGAGKTTLSGKLALHLKKSGKKPLLVACDIYRPAAIDQLKVVGSQAGVEVYEEGTKKPAIIAQNAVKYAKQFGFDTVIIDTAGRLHIDEELMQELNEISSTIKPTEILLTIDSMTGQDAVNVAKTFDEKLSLTGCVLTKLDGDTRGGACLSVKAVTGKPIKFSSVGEKLQDLEPFYPDRMAKRILGMGDVMSLIEKAQEAITEEDAKALEKRLKESTFTLEDFLSQFEMIKKMGGVNDIMSMLPGMNMGKLKGLKGGEIDESKIERIKAIIYSMTKKERRDPSILNYSRKNRIASGSGTSVQEINQLLKQYDQTKLLMKQFKNGKRRLPFM
jgi:signal recognition particle subunit SRP54